MNTRARKGRLCLLILAALSGMAFAGCSRKPAASNVASANAPFRMMLRVTPRTPRQLDNVQFMAAIANTAHKGPVHGAAVNIELTMPEMQMPPNIVACHETSSGIYTGMGRFTMNGVWQATVTANQKTITGSQVFPVTVK